jgi:hypothetical protein
VGKDIIKKFADTKKDGMQLREGENEENKGQPECKHKCD